AVDHPLLKGGTTLPDGGHLFGGKLRLHELSWVRDHVVFDQVVFPGAGLVELVLMAGRQVGAPRIHGLTLESPLVVPGGEGLRHQLRVESASGEGSRDFSIHSLSGDADGEQVWRRHATGVLAAAGEHGAADVVLAKWPPENGEQITLDGLYERLGATGLH